MTGEKFQDSKSLRTYCGKSTNVNIQFTTALRHVLFDDLVGRSRDSRRMLANRLMSMFGFCLHPMEDPEMKWMAASFVAVINDTLCSFRAPFKKSIAKGLGRQRMAMANGESDSSDEDDHDPHDEDDDVVDARPASKEEWGAG